MLPRRRLGQHGPLVSALGLGTVKIGRNQGIKYPQGFDLPDDRQVLTLLDCARELGINVLDTAPAYGSSEERLGRLLQDRERWVLVSKAGEDFHDGQSHFDFSAAGLRASVERSLRRLRTDRIDVLLLHSDGADRQRLEEGALATLVQLREEGKVVAVGVSSKTVDGALACLPQADVMMLSYRPDHLVEAPVLAACQERGIGVLIKKALSSGHLGGDPERQAQEQLRFIWDHPATSCIVVGTLNPQHLRSNAAAFSRPAGESL